MTIPTEVAELIAAAESYQKAHLKVSDLKEFGGPEYMYGSEWREATCREGNEYCRLSNAVRACKESALTKAEAVPIAWIRATMVETLTKDVTHLIKCGAKQEHPNDVPLYAHAPPAVPVESLGRDAEPVRYGFDFIALTNREYAEWCAKTYTPEDMADKNGCMSLHGLWAWQEQERRKMAKPAEPVASVPDHVRKLVGRIDMYRLCMSYNESYFGEPAGLLKGVFSELAHAINPIYPSGKTALATGQKSESLGGVVLHLSDGRTVHLSDATPPTNQEGAAP